LETYVIRGAWGERDPRPRIIRGFSLHLCGDAAVGNLCVALFSKEVAEDKSAGFELGAEAI
jgi:hypothetical protein